MPSVILYDAVRFDGNQLNAIAGLTVLAIDPYKPANRALRINQLARMDKRRVSGAFWDQKQIRVRIGIGRSNRAQAETSLDQLLAITTGQEKELIVPQGVISAVTPTTRKYICTLADMVPREEGGSYLEFDMIFECSDSFGYDTVYTTNLNISGITSSTRGDQIPFDGSAPWQVPVILVTYGTITGGTGKTVTIGNPAIGQNIIISRTWLTGDQLEIDSFNKTVKVNGMAVDFTGAFPEWAPGLGNWSYSDNLTTRTFAAKMTYYRRFI